MSNPLFVSLLGLFLVLISIRLNVIIKEEKSICLKSLQNYNYAIIVIGILLIISSLVGNPMYMYFVIILCIFSVVLFSLILINLNKCKVSLSSFDSAMILCGFIGPIVGIILMCKNLYDNRILIDLNLSRSSSPKRESYIDSFGLDSVRSFSPKRESYIDSFGLDSVKSFSPKRKSIDSFGLDF